MFTRCPQCEAVHALSAALLASRRGTIRCARCDRVFDALARLYDEWPRSGSRAAEFEADGPPPVAGSTTLAAPLEGSPEPAPEKARARIRPPMAWLLAALLVLTLVHLVWTFREHLAEVPPLRAALESTGWVAPGAGPDAFDPTLIHLVSRDLHAHPNLAGMLALSATFVSRAEERQRYPDVELTLFDAGNEPLARRRFTPNEYLPGGIVPPAGLAPGVHVPILLEFADPGGNAIGFELRFR